MPGLSEPIEFLNELHKAGVRYLLIGRRSIIAYGGPVQTMDYDIYVDRKESNLDLFLKIAGNFDLLPSISKEEIKRHFKFKLENDFTIDVFCPRYFSTGKGKKVSFDELYERRNIAKGETGLKINLPSIDDLIELKRLGSRPKDIEDIKYLEGIKKQQKDRNK
jgi:hypothetical protein